MLPRCRYQRRNKPARPFEESDQTEYLSIERFADDEYVGSSKESASRSRYRTRRSPGVEELALAVGQEAVQRTLSDAHWDPE
jgi:hypothetical protein